MKNFWIDVFGAMKGDEPMTEEEVAEAYGEELQTVFGHIKELIEGLELKEALKYIESLKEEY